MGPKAQQQKPSKKAQKEKLEKKLEESTFGMKNKNKSSKVKQFIDRATKSVKNSGVFADSVIHLSLFENNLILSCAGEI